MKRFSLSLGALMLSLVLAEIALRFFDYPFHSTWTPSETSLARFDPELGWSYIPNLSATQRFASDQREIAMHFDDIGARVPSPGYRHDPTAPSVLFVGDSYTMGHGVPYEDTVAGQMEASSDFPLQSVNLGVQGFGTDQTLLQLKRHFHRFQTVAVVYTFIDDHVVRNANRDRRLIYPAGRFLGTKPRYGLRSDGTLYQRDRPERYESRGQCRLLQVLQLAWERLGPRPSWELSRALVGEMRDYVESNGAQFVLVHWTRAHPDTGLEPAFPEEMELNLIDTGAGRTSEWDAWHLPGDAHPDRRANAYVARLVIDMLKRLGLV